VDFERHEIEAATASLGIKLPKNQGDAIYSLRYRVRLSVVQIEQDLALAAQKFPGLVCRAIGAQFMEEGIIALFEFEAGENGGYCPGGTSLPACATGGTVV
jgi:hypothetical protein